MRRAFEEGEQVGLVEVQVVDAKLVQVLDEGLVLEVLVARVYVEEADEDRGEKGRGDRDEDLPADAVRHEHVERRGDEEQDDERDEGVDVALQVARLDALPERCFVRVHADHPFLLRK